MRVMGQQKIQEFLKKSIQSDCLNHAYILFGPPKVGKKILAQWFVKQLLCQKDANEACDTCFGCTQLAQHTHPDLTILVKEAEKKDISVKQIRLLITSLQKSSFYNGYKVGIIHDAQYLNTQASNALLKTLEEPVKNTIIILTVPNLENLLPTIVSRCHKLYCAPVNTSLIYDEVLRATKNHDQAKLVSRLSLGRPELMQEFLEEKDKMELMIADAQLMLDILRTKDISEKFTYLQAAIISKESQQVKEEVIRLCDHWLLVLFDIIFIHLSRVDALCYVSLEENLRKISMIYSLQECQQLAVYLLDLKKQLNTNVNARYILENYLLNTK